MRTHIHTLFEDEHLLIVQKPSGLLSIPDRFDLEKENAHKLLQQQHDGLLPVHRLDRGTSGVLVFAKNTQAQRDMSQLFEKRQIEKVYNALVRGRPYPNAGTIEASIASANRGRMAIDPKGKPALTHYKVLEQFRSFAWVEARIETGRTHQIRLHFSHSGFPLAVDRLYSKTDSLMLSTIKLKNFRLAKHQPEHPLLSRLSLHARNIGFQHPITKQPINIEAALPKDLRATLAQLRKWG